MRKVTKQVRELGIKILQFNQTKAHKIFWSVFMKLFSTYCTLLLISFTAHYLVIFYLR